MDRTQCPFNDPDKQWITVDVYPSSPALQRTMRWDDITFNPSSVFASFSDAKLPTGSNGLGRTCRPSDDQRPTVGQLHAPPRHTRTVLCTRQKRTTRRTWVSVCRSICVASHDGGVCSWQTPLCAPRPSFLFRCIRTTSSAKASSTRFGGRGTPCERPAPDILVVSWDDGSSGVSNIYLTSPLMRAHMVRPDRRDDNCQSRG